MSIEDDYIEENALAALKDCAKVVIGSGEIGSGLPKRLICLDRKKLSSCCTAIKRRLVMMAFDEVGAVQDIEYVHVEAVIKLLGCSPGAKTQAPGARVVLNQNNVYFFAGEKELPNEEIRRIEAAEICEGMAVRTGTGVFRLRLIRDEELKKGSSVRARLRNSRDTLTGKGSPLSSRYAKGRRAICSGGSMLPEAKASTIFSSTARWTE